MTINGSITKNEPIWYQCECCAKFLTLSEPLADGVKAFTICNCQQGAYRRWAANPDCRHCGGKLASTADDCACADAVQEREARAAEYAKADELYEQKAKAAQEAKASIGPPPPARDDGWAPLRKEAELDRRRAALADAKLDLEEREVAARLRQLDATSADTPAVGLTLADFTKEITLLGVARLPSAFERLDGETLLYQGLDNTVYGEVSIGKSWLALMAAVQQLRAGARVLWWDAEDKPTTLARRLQLLKATNLIGHPDLKWASGELTASPSAMFDALDFLGGGEIPGLVVIDSATSFGCPADNRDPQPWLKANIKPWLDMGNTTLLLDHVPKQRKDRPDGGVGGFQKLQDIQGAGIYVHGRPWNGTEGGELSLTVHKDRHGQLPVPKYGTAATVYVEWAEDKLTLDWTIGLPTAKPEGEDLQDELMEAFNRAGAEGVRGSKGVRDLLTGKGVKDIDKARDELLHAGMIQRVKQGRAWVYMNVTA